MTSKHCQICFLLVVISQIFIVIEAKSQGYETKYDDIDLDELLKNDRLRHSYIKCLMGEGTYFWRLKHGIRIKIALIKKFRPMHSWWTGIKKWVKLSIGFFTVSTTNLSILTAALPDAIQSECSKCSEKQKDGADKVTHYLIDNKPDEWQKLADKYDKDDDYKTKYLLEKEKSKTTTDTESSKDSEED